MHAEAYAFLRRFATADTLRVIELGSREAWGPRVRDLFPHADYFGIDAVAGPGVDWIANAADWRPDDLFDLAICAEVFEHTPRWREIVGNAAGMLRSGGRAVFTCAGPERPVHGLLRDDPDERGYYANVAAEELAREMLAAGFVEVRVEEGENLTCGGTDTYATGVRP